MISTRLSENNRSAIINIILGNGFLLYCVLFEGLNIFSLIFLFYIDLILSAAFTLSKSRRAAIDETINNDFKFPGKLTHWDEKRYRGKSAYSFVAGNLIMLSVAYIFLIMAPPAFMKNELSGHELYVELYPFLSPWFWICVAVNILLYSGMQFYYFASRFFELESFEKLITLDYFKYWMFLSFIVVAFTTNGLLRFEHKNMETMVTIVVAIIYISMKSFLEIRERKKHFMGDE